MIGRTIDSQHSVHKHADAVGHALDVAQHVRAEQNRPAAALDDLDHRLQEIAPDIGVQAESRVVEDEEFRIRGDGERQR